ncbi:MAG TPA: phosphoserine phosphatase SerB [Bordetella sp.]
MLLVLQSPEPWSPEAIAESAALCGATRTVPVDARRIRHETQLPPASWRESLLAFCARHQADAAMLHAPRPLPGYRLMVFDMDSTLIDIECIDELAARVGRGAEVAALTDKAMRDPTVAYDDSLRARVRCLQGMTLAEMEAVYAERVRFNPGARELIADARGLGLRTALVSGGFNEFARRVQRELGIDEVVCNGLETRDGRLTGEMTGTLVNAREKARALARFCDQIGCPTTDAIAVGDGANDLEMMAIAGLSVSYRAKPVVRRRADVLIDHGTLHDLVALLAG